MHVESFACGPLGCNCSIVADLEKKQALVIDPGGDLASLLARLAKHDLKVAAIVHTHTHIDHVGATAALQKKTGSKASIHEADRFLYDLLPVQAAMLGMPDVPEKADIDGSLVDGQALAIGDLEIGVLHTPGHTPGSVCIVAKRGDQTKVFAGDTLFKSSIGRTDLWGGDHGAIIKSIKGKLLTLPDDTVVVTGHGPSTTIGDERVKNPFVGGR